MAGVVKSITASNGRLTAASGGLVAYADVQDVADQRLLGRAAGTPGTIQEITVGAGLALAAGELSATGGTTSPLTTKGDVWVYTAADARLPVGADGYVLTADSGEASGLKWSAPAAGYTDEEAQDAVGTILTDSSTIDFTYDDGVPSITGSVITQMSLTSDASGLKLSGDSATPGNSKLYGTDSSGVKGWYDSGPRSTAAGTLIGRNAGTGTGVPVTVSLAADSNLVMSSISPIGLHAGVREITQAAHGFADGDILRLSGSTYVKAQADSVANATVVGIATSTGSADDFLMTYTNGYVTGLSGLSAGTVYYLSATTAGAMTSTAPTGSGTVSRPVFVADSTTSGYFLGGTPPPGTLAETRGGTSQTTYTTGDVLYASAANTLAKLAVGSAGHVLTVASGVPSWAAVPTATSGGSSLGSDYTFTSTSYGDSGLSITLPAAGTYLITGTFNFKCQVSLGQGAIDVQLYNTTDSAAVSGSDRRAGACTGQDLANWSSSAATWLVTVTASKTIRLEAKRVTLVSPVWVASTLVGTYTRLDYVRLA